MKFRSARVLPIILVFVSTLFASPKAKADAARDFLMSCSYGVLAGTLVGAASLAFADKPGESLNRVARGASIGLYAGILLGLYVVYAVPSEEDEMRDLIGPYGQEPRWALLPVVNERGLDGVSAQFRLLDF